MQREPCDVQTAATAIMEIARQLVVVPPFSLGALTNPQRPCDATRRSSRHRWRAWSSWAIPTLPPILQRGAIRRRSGLC